MEARSNLIIRQIRRSPARRDGDESGRERTVDGQKPMKATE